ncbi:MAG: hypothetical protein JW742_02220 [Candidatus Aminicenantes bacterium]|nr:hypothetical protein [Candidatus Aminicenantes bacterium]
MFRGCLGGLAVLALIATAPGCKSPTAPDEGEADILVSNEVGETVDLYMDGELQFAVRDQWTIEIDDVELADHELVAKRAGTDVVLDATTIEVTDRVDYAWMIDDPPDIKVTNVCGQSVRVELDGVYQFDLVDDENRWIIDVAYGRRFLKACRLSDGREIASTTIAVDDNKDYEWTIAVLVLR